MVRTNIGALCLALVGVQLFLGSVPIQGTALGKFRSASKKVVSAGQFIGRAMSVNDHSNHHQRQQRLPHSHKTAGASASSQSGGGAAIAAAAVPEVPREEEKCTICLENLENGERKRELPCKHTFHADCIKEWLDTNPTCPVCRHNPSQGAPVPQAQNSAPQRAPMPPPIRRPQQPVVHNEFEAHPQSWSDGEEDNYEQSWERDMRQQQQQMAAYHRQQHSEWTNSDDGPHHHYLPPHHHHQVNFGGQHAFYQQGQQHSVMAPPPPPPVDSFDGFFLGTSSADWLRRYHSLTPTAHGK